MLRNILSVGIILSSTAAHAQGHSFDTNLSLEMVSATFKPAEAYIISSQTQWTVGNFALQADVSLSASYDAAIFATSISPRISGEYAVLGFHAALAKNESFRLGGFATLAFPADNISS